MTRVCCWSIRHTPYAIRHTPYAIRHTPYAIRHTPRQDIESLWCVKGFFSAINILPGTWFFRELPVNILFIVFFGAIVQHPKRIARCRGRAIRPMVQETPGISG
ncbi:hypothetical protein [Candidatus Methylospira mobilis]|uniref:hypothetical protein n=1 Tax=Candidatus Methylospira mobilis TaxID=1808979 RepID=UPI0012931A2A|nr:hypothetical protein [Candidatus Methylospira mobilis]